MSLLRKLPIIPTSIKPSFRFVVKVLLAITTVLLLTELCLRVAVVNRPIAAHCFLRQDDATGYSLAPGCQHRFFQGGRLIDVTTDEQGKRLTVEAEAGEARSGHSRLPIHVVGDSQVFGWGLSDDESITSQLQVLLGPNYQVVNHGVPGYGPFQYAEVVSSIDTREFVIVLFSIENDLTNTYSARTGMTSRFGYLMREGCLATRLPAWIACSHLYIRSSQAIQSLSEPRLVSIAYNPFAEIASKTLAYRVNRIQSQIKEERGDKVCFGVIPWDAALCPGRLENYKPRFSEVSQVADINGELGLYATFQAELDPERLFLKNDSHLSGAGARMVAEVLAKNILSNLEVAP